MPSLKRLRTILPLILILGAIVLAMMIVKTKPAVAKRQLEIQPPLVRVLDVIQEELTMNVLSQGTVQPAKQSQLTAEVSGKIKQISNRFSEGSFFDIGDELLRIDDLDYQQNLIVAKAELARAELRLAQEEAESSIARQEWTALGQQSNADPLTLRLPQLNEARAACAAAQARVERADRDLQRCIINAPYAGRIMQATVDEGQFVGIGTPLASIYGIDAVEIILAIDDGELAYLDMDLTNSDMHADVQIKTQFAGEAFEWSGNITRSMGSIDPQTRLMQLVAQVKNPYQTHKPPLTPGMFVNAEIKGRILKGLTTIPREALRGDHQVLVVDNNNCLRFRDIKVVRRTTESVLIGEGLIAGERVAISRLEVVTDGMKIEPYQPDEPSVQGGS